MGNTINKIQEGFYICGVEALNPTSRLQELGIKCVLNAATADLYPISRRTGKLEENLREAGLEIFIVGADDAPHFNLSNHFEEIADFIEAGRAKGGVVVHCAAGISRATTSCCAYLMMKEQWTLEAAFFQVHGVRRYVRPNEGFWRQLRDLEASLLHKGVELKPLPQDWVLPAQPEPEEEEKDGPTDSEERRALTRDRICEMDEEAAKVSKDRFVTQYLTGMVLPATGTSSEQLADIIRASELVGIVWENIAAEADRVMLRVGLVPTLDAATLHRLLSRLPGAASASVEGL